MTEAQSKLAQQWEVFMQKAAENRKRARSASRSPPRAARGPPPTPMKKKQRVEPRAVYLVGGAPPAYEMVKRIGAGTFGEVWAIEKRGTSETKDVPLAVKFSNNPKRAASMRSVWTDAMLLLRNVPAHPNVATVHHAWIDVDDVLFCIMERGTESLKSRLERKGEVDVKQLEQHLRAGVETLHKNNVLHTDIVPGNIVWFEHDRQWKLVDMDQCAPADEKNDRDGDQRYMAPGMLETGATVETDLYAIDVIMAEVKGSM